MKQKLLALLFTLISTTTMAGPPGFDNITSTDMDNISKEFSANFIHRPVSPASTMGSLFGFEVGIIAGITDAPKIAEITKREDPTESDPIDKLAHAGLVGGVTVPFGITAELVLLPEQNLGDIDISNYSIGVKWTFSKYLPIPMVDLAVRGHYSTSEMSYSDTVDAVSTTVKLENSTSGATLLASVNLMVIEPFVGVGYVTRESTLSASGSAQIFDSSFTTSQSQTVDGSSSQLLVGAELNLLFMNIAAQYENVFDSSVMSAKLSFGF